MEYCTRCMYPANSRPTIILDEEGVCSGCRYHESREQLELDWEEREGMFAQIAEEARARASRRNASHDCIIPVSGGKDSHYQVWLLKKKYGMNPLLVAFNHAFNTPAGVRNLENLVSKSGCDLVRYTAGVDSVRRVSRHMLETVGDLTWHYHAGIRTLPFQVAVAYDIPLVVWGEHGYAELTGLVTLEDFVEFTKWTRKEHDMRGYEPEDLIGKGGITAHDVRPYVYPSDDEIAKADIRGIYLSNFFDWDAKRQGEDMIREWDFGPITYRRDRTFNLYAKIDDHANDVHDYLKYLKFGYGRATDDASTEVRHGRMSRAEAIQMVETYDATEPQSLEFYCDFLGISVGQFYDMVTPMRDEALWQRRDGEWVAVDNIMQHPITDHHEAMAVEQSNDRVFAPHNRHLYYNPDNPPLPVGDVARDVPTREFKVL